MKAAEFLLNLDRRWIFALIALAVLIPVLFEIKLPGIKVTDPVRNYHKVIEALPEGSPVLISADFDPGGKPELYPMLEATLRHAFKKKLRVVVMTLWVTGVGMVEKAVKDNAEYARKHFGVDPQPGRDYAFMGWRAGGSAVIIGMGADIYKQFGTDTTGKPLKGQPVMEGIEGLEDFKLMVCLAAGVPGFNEWVQYAVEKYHLPFNGGCTGVIMPEAYPYMQAGQMVGLLGGLKGAAEYEDIVGVPGRAMLGQVALSFALFTIILLIVGCNVLYVATGRQRPGGEGA